MMNRGDESFLYSKGKDRVGQNTPQPQRYRNRKYARKLDADCVVIARGGFKPLAGSRRMR